jgi:hypothetical protein
MSSMETFRRTGRRRDSTIVNVLRGYCEGFVLPPLPESLPNRELLDSAVSQTHAALQFRDLDSIIEGLSVLCSLFEFPGPHSVDFSRLLRDHPLIHVLIACFDEDWIIPAVERVAALFVNLIALDSSFTSPFLDQANVPLRREKVFHVRSMLGPGRPLPHLLLYNLYSCESIAQQSLEETLDLEGYLALAIQALADGDRQTLFFAPFVMSSMLRTVPIPHTGVPEDDVYHHAMFAKGTARLMRYAAPEDLKTVIWAIYFWFQRNADGDDLWDGLTLKFVRAIAGLLRCPDREIMRFALYAYAYLLLIRTEVRDEARSKHRKDIVKEMRKCFPMDAVAALIAAEDPQVSEYAFILLTNFVAFDRSNFVRVCTDENDFLDIALRVLQEGAVKAKCQAAHFACVFLYLHTRDELVERATVEMLPLLMDALELEDPELSGEIMRLLMRCVRDLPGSTDFLLSTDFDLYLLDTIGKIDVEGRNDNLYFILEAQRRLRGDEREFRES